MAKRLNYVPFWGRIGSYFRTNHIALIELLVIGVSAWVIWRQLDENSNQNKVAIRGQLYQMEVDIAKQGMEDNILSSIWVKVPIEISDSILASTVLSATNKSPRVLRVKTASELLDIIWNPRYASDTTLKDEIISLRKIFLYAQNSLYHVHNAFDYTESGILDPGEFETWKGIIRDMSAHPVFLTTVYQGYKLRYFSKKFAVFLHEELCVENPKGLMEEADRSEYFRNRRFINQFYHEMMSKEWADKMPDY